MAPSLVWLIHLILILFKIRFVWGEGISSHKGVLIEFAKQNLTLISICLAEILQNYYYDLGHETSLHKFVGDFNVTKSAS